MASVGKKTDKKTQAGRDVYKTPEGEMVSEKSTTFEYKGKWINIPTIHNGKQYSEDELMQMLNEGLIKPTSIHNELEDALQAAEERSKSLKFNKGGIPMYAQQMNLFNEGGLKDEGGMVDEVSGNDVPIGSTRKEVRDDVPAMLSEGEFVFPADVVRYIGLEELMKMRQEAKMGLKRMEAMGQMGNSEEATMPDDMPFTEADIIIMAGEPEEKREMNRGGVIYAQNGTYVQPSMFASQPPINPYQYAPPASAFSPTGYMPQQNMQQQTQTSGYRPRFVEQGVQRKVPISMSKDFVQEVFRDVKYINPETGDIITLRLNSMGVPIDRPEIPEGYIPYTDYLEGATGTPTTPEGETPAATPQPQRDDDRGPSMPTPEPFNWDEASPEAIVNEVKKINSGMGTVFTGIAFAINPLFGALSSTMMKANEKSTLSKLNEKLKDPAFVAKMKKEGQLEALKGELTKLEEKADKGILSGSILGVLGEVMTSVGDALGLSDEQKKSATSNVIKAETAKTDVKVDENGKVTTEETVLVTDEGLAAQGIGSLDAAVRYSQDLKTKADLAAQGIGSLDAAVRYSQGLGEAPTDDIIAAKAASDSAAQTLKTSGVTADTITQEQFDTIKNSAEAKRSLGIDPLVTNYSEFKRLREQTPVPLTTQTITDDETGEVLEVGVESATVRDDTAAALGTEPVDVSTMTSDELAEVIFGLTGDDLLTYSELVNSGVSTKAALDFYVNGNAVGLAQDIYDKNIGSVLKDIDKGTASKIEMIFANKQIQYKDDDDRGPIIPTSISTTPDPELVTEVETYLSSIADDDDDGVAPTPSVTAPTYAQPSQDPYAEAGRPTGGGDDDSGAPAPSYTQPSQDPYAEAGRPTGGGRDSDGPSAAQQAAASARKAAEGGRDSAAQAAAVTQKIRDDKEKRTIEAGQMAGKGYVGGYGFNEGGLVGKPKKKKATPKKRGMAARK